MMLRSICLMAVCVFGGLVLAADDKVAGEKTYHQKCASCHGKAGEGVIDKYAQPLIGDRSIGELTEYIAKTMPEDKPGTCTGQEARNVSAFIHEAFYSATAQARNKPARVELSRLTVKQYRLALAELVGSFRPSSKLDDQRGLKGNYFKGRGNRKEERFIDRIDPNVNFVWSEQGPDPEKAKDLVEYTVQWEGSVLAPETGEYEFVVETEHATRLWINDPKVPLIDAWVKSGNDTVYRQSIYLIGGRYYPLKLDFTKAKQGVDDKKENKFAAKTASIALEWKRPRLVSETIEARYLIPMRVAESYINSTPFPPDDRSIGYERGSSVSKSWDQATTDGALETANYILTRLPELSGIRIDDKDRANRLQEFATRFATRAFRRPFADDVKALYVARHFENPNDADLALKKSLLLVLKSPRFLFREVDQSNDSYEVASRLSFALWDSPPDSVLLDAAAKGELSSREQLLKQAERLMSDLKARTKLREFLLQWLKVEQHPDVSKDSMQFPDFTPQIAADLRTSLEVVIDELLARQQSDFRELLLSEQVPLNGRLAKFYGVDLPLDAGFQPATLATGERAGVITHPYLLASFAYTASSSPIHRGVFLSRSVLGRALRVPPEAVAPLSPDLHPNLTTRERVVLQTKPEACQSCHVMINALGFTLENFDAVGRYRSQEHGKSIDSSGSYRTRTDEVVTFKGPRDMATFLAASDEVHGALVEQLFQHLIKQPIRAYGLSTGSDLKAAFARDGFNLKRLAAEIAVTAGKPTIGLADEKK